MRSLLALTLVSYWYPFWIWTPCQIYGFTMNTQYTHTHRQILYFGSGSMSESATFSLSLSLSCWLLDVGWWSSVKEKNPWQKKEKRDVQSKKKEEFDFQTRICQVVRFSITSQASRAYLYFPFGLNSTYITHSILLQYISHSYTWTSYLCTYNYRTGNNIWICTDLFTLLYISIHTSISRTVEFHFCTTNLLCIFYIWHCTI